MMSDKQRQRFIRIVYLMTGTALAAGLILYAFSNNIDLYYTPTHCQSLPADYPKVIRVGGMVVKGSVHRESDLRVRFTITDYQQDLNISYEGILPDLFREGQGVVILGKKQSNAPFEATQVLAKHDEKYMPPEIAKQMKQANTGAAIDIAGDA
jgi:cytochrome c-type biogenesis protein CcmE